jgi:hypothetical protein
MNFKLIITLLLVVSASTFFSACTSVESKSSEEVVIDRSSKGATEEVYITNSDTKGLSQPVTALPKGAQLGKRILSDKSEIETMIDGFGNKMETRFFVGHPRIRLLIVRTNVKGVQEVTVYGNAGITKIVGGLGDRALTASGDEIANAAQLYATSSYGGAKNFMKRPKTETQQPPLQPLPSSAFQKPLQPVNQPAETVQPTTNASSETTTPQQNKPEED